MGNVYSPQHYASQDSNNANNNNPLATNDNTNLLTLNAGRREGDLGFRADLSSLLSFPYRTNFPPPSIHEATTVKSTVNVNKDTLQLVRDENFPNHYRIKFVYDATTPCTIRVNFLVKDTIAGIQARSETPSVVGEKGFGIVFTQPPEHYLDTSLYSQEDLSYTANSTSFPVAIAIQSISDEPSKSDDSNIILSQTTFATLLHCADDSYAIKVVKQRFPHLGHMYNLHDIFGLDYTGERESEGSRECVVCLSEPRDTTILPCNHLCLCSACAELMRTQTNKCPICRAPVKKLLTIHLTNNTGLGGSRELPTCLTSDRLKEKGEEAPDEKEDELLSRRERDKL